VAQERNHWHSSALSGKSFPPAVDACLGGAGGWWWLSS